MQLGPPVDSPDSTVTKIFDSFSLLLIVPFDVLILFFQVFLFFFLFCGMGFELRGFTLSHSTSPIFVMTFFEIGSHELFTWSGHDPSDL
jgi:hypothetical protein